jgi:hypothetical protein
MRKVELTIEEHEEIRAQVRGEAEKSVPVEVLPAALNGSEN